MDDALSELLGDFLLEAQERLRKLNDLLERLPFQEVAARAEALTEVRRELHTLKGNSGMMGFRDLQELAHRLEDGVDEVDPQAPDLGLLRDGLRSFRQQVDQVERPDSDAEGRVSGDAIDDGGHLEGSVRVSLARLNRLVDLTTEQVVARGRLVEALKVLGNGDGVGGGDLAAGIGESYRDLEKSLDAVQDEILRLRMVPLRSLFGQLRQVAHDEARRVCKEVQFVSAGESTPLDKTLIEFATDTLGHLVRNAITHGIELPEVRLAAGKPKRGRVHVEARASADSVDIEVVDDGEGIDRAKVLMAAERRGIDTGSVEDPLSLIYHPGFSTQSKADLAAGRGIGLSAVLESVHRQGGTMGLQSEPGRGTRFQIQLPMSVSIAQALLVKVRGETYALPASAVLETVPWSDVTGLGRAAGATWAWRGREIPLLDLRSVLAADGGEGEVGGYIAVVAAEGRLAGLLVDDLGELEKIVVRGLDPVLGALTAFSGSTVLGDGRVVMILDVPGLTAEHWFVGGVA